MSRATGRHWVVIETGANQAYIFGTNKQKVNVGASQQVWRVGCEWARQAIAKFSAGKVSRAIIASGKALLLVDTPDTGRAVIRAVTGRALVEAPDLEVWGIVDPQPVASDQEVGEALARAYQLHAAWRARRPATSLRHPTLPFTQRCHFTGRPAVDFLDDSERHVPVSAGVKSAADQRNHGRARMAEGCGEKAVVTPDRLNDGVDHGGWIAVIHADGNGIGDIFRLLADVYTGDEFLDRLKRFSRALDLVTIAAVREAVRRQEERHPGRREWLLPLIVGGDDVTAVMDGRLAFDFAVDFLRAFADQSAGNVEMSRVLNRINAGADAGASVNGLTASAGIAYVKPHYSFSAAYQLADELCTSAKAVKHHAPGCGGLDFHVLHDSVGLPLAKLRAQSRVNDGGRPLKLWPGPIVVPREGTESIGWADRRGLHHLIELIAHLHAMKDRSVPQEAHHGEPVLSRAALHKLRQALTYGGAEIDRAAEQVTAWASDEAQELLKKHLRVSALDDDEAFSRIPGAMDLLDMEIGTGAGAEQRTVVTSA